MASSFQVKSRKQQMKANRAGLGVHATDNQEGKMELYMLSLAVLCVSESSVSGSVTAAPETIKLWLPSQISRTAPCNSCLQAIKWKLQYAQDLLWGETEGTRKLLWIWNMQGAAANNIDKDNASEDMQIEWCKARAQTNWTNTLALVDTFDHNSLIAQQDMDMDT
ncbi:uncharacterized protein BJ212DRAFT_1298611 [Suillus subaureus]|uniref:Uncharacterized protein n=1 Tax=Suillus subaureus TaxID=48587 RepID=A0A9P7EE25_9AGAM|nr:uncharacterized protein BJ212DRAFT_1298611 [Suillus subaureus]KAG1818520.1 hypothetical protein BJ212DRAFT_1298611 [Suillus subaureus]